MKKHVPLIILLVISQLVFAEKTSKFMNETTQDELVYCDRVLFEIEYPKTKETIICYNENDGKKYIRIIGVKNKLIQRNIQIPVDSESDYSPYYKVYDDSLEFLISNIKESKEYKINLLTNKIEEQPFDEAKYYEFPFNTKYYSNQKDFISYGENEKKINTSKILGRMKLFNDYFIFEEDTNPKNDVIFYTELLNTKFLLVISDSEQNIYKYGDKEYRYYFTQSLNYKSNPELKPFEINKANSYISEKTSGSTNVEYVPKKYFSLEENPWAVEDKKSDKSIQIKIQETKEKAIEVKHLIIANGFTCKKKLYLFDHNSRAKKLLLSYGNTKQEVILKDTPNLQIITLDNILNKNDYLNVEILDSYEGTKYSDIVISGIYYFYAEER